MRQENGFSLIELMIVVGLIGLLTAIATPMYNSYLIKANRSAVQAFMIDVASKEDEYASKTWSYVGQDDVTKTADDLLELGITTGIPPDVAKHYDIRIAATAAPPSYVVIADPSAKGTFQQNDGELRLNSNGLKTPKGLW